MNPITHAEITQIGHWTYAICIRDGLTVTYPPWYRIGRNSAERKARKELARRRQSKVRQEEVTRVYLDEELP